MTPALESLLVEYVVASARFDVAKLTNPNNGGGAYYPDADRKLVEAATDLIDVSRRLCQFMGVPL